MEIEEDEEILFLIHQHADPDAIGSAYFLQNRWGGTVASPTGPNGTGKNLLTFLGFDLEQRVDLERFDRIFVLDTPDPTQLEELTPPDHRTVVIDHHQNFSWDADVIFEDRTSCVEIVYDMVEPKELTEKEGMALVSGILTDTSSLSRGDSRTFKTLSDIMEKSGVSLEKVRSMLYDTRSYSEKIARLKGVQRSNFSEVNGFIMAKTKIGAFESSVSNYLIRGGADIALSASKKGDTFRISGRAEEEAVELGIDLGKIFQTISDESEDISGGGHPGAGVITGQDDLDLIIDDCMEEITKFIREKGIGKSKD